MADAHRRQTKSRRRNAGDAAGVTAISQRAIAHQAGVLARLAPEKQERAADDFFQKFFAIQPPIGWHRLRRPVLRVAKRSVQLSFRKGIS